MSDVDFDVLIVGAGLSGIAAAYYVQTRLPRARYSVLEARDAIGGTWDLFRYPGVRSDSDMHTLGYSFYPWKGDIVLADGPSIKTYVTQTARHFAIDRRIRFGERLAHASWDSRAARWTIDVNVRGAATRYTCRFLYFGSGYYDYERGYVPSWNGIDAYRGVFLHPQAWPDDLDCRGKRVLVIGSGATAVTIVPAIARAAAHVTMLQRTPTYIVSLPSHDGVARWFYRILPEQVAHGAIRWKNVLLQMFYYTVMRKRPQQTRERIKELTREAVGPNVDVDAHFTPPYEPWDQRLCLVPDNDLFDALREGRASIVTGTIETFTESGVRLVSGEPVDADIVVAATGLNVKLFGGATLDVDGVPVVLRDRVSYKGMMLDGVPNVALALGYTNASWTLKCELTALYVTRLIAYMDRHGYRACAPAMPPAGVEREPAISLTSGYISRALDALPRQGSHAPWRLYQNYAFDLAALRLGRVNDGVMEFIR